MDYEKLKNEDKLALAEAYRVYELLSGPEQEKIPEEFVNILLNYGDLSLIGPLDPNKDLENQNLSKRGLYLVMYMCTFE